MKRLVLALTGAALFGLAAFLLITAPRMSATEGLDLLTADPGHGEQVFTAAGCASCHMAPGATGQAQRLLAGGQEFASPFGTFVAPNISPDPTAGIGGWTLAQFAGALRDGVSPEGSHYYPALPYAAYAKMTDQDLVDLWAFVQTLPPAATPSQPHRIGFPFNIRRSLGGWKLVFQTRGWVLDNAPTPELERGRYIVEALAHCGECHTPRNVFGGLKTGQWLGGAADPSGKGRIPNITPGRLSWSEGEIVEYLTTGFTPEFDSVGGHMAHVVDNMAALPESDRKAVAAYLKAIPAVAGE